MSTSRLTLAPLRFRRGGSAKAQAILQDRSQDHAPSPPPSPNTHGYAGEREWSVADSTGDVVAAHLSSTPPTSVRAAALRRAQSVRCVSRINYYSFQVGAR